MPKPKIKTAKVTIELANDDGSKTIISTEELDGSMLPDHYGSHPEERVEHIVVGMVNPFNDGNEWSSWDLYQNRPAWPKLPDTHFQVQLRLPPVKAGHTVYTVRHIDPPLKRVICYVRSEDKQKTIVFSRFSTEAELMEELDPWDFENSIYFFLDIP